MSLPHAIKPIQCNCGRPAESGRESVHGWHYAGCRPCGIYVSCNSADELPSRYRARLDRPLMSDAFRGNWWEMGEEL